MLSAQVSSFAMSSLTAAHAAHSWHVANLQAVQPTNLCVQKGGDIRDIRQAVLDKPYSKNPPTSHRIARVWQPRCSFLTQSGSTCLYGVAFFCSCVEQMCRNFFAAVRSATQIANRVCWPGCTSASWHFSCESTFCNFRVCMLTACMPLSLNIAMSLSVTVTSSIYIVDRSCNTTVT